ncbi:hypothetical protein LptCag_0619 [Leptospirillum ferriphilum]|jgi:hypothetical protein|uniref:Uncharacterized protein n=1 Tax=Leptospirillum ferriphilum TaxID=178606 RepID=A0A094W8Z7_9BACT|nr:hypothetical protein LptCag_0619 [Leptospirillum ferriphilum]
MVVLIRCCFKLISALDTLEKLVLGEESGEHATKKKDMGLP